MADRYKVVYDLESRIRRSLKVIQTGTIRKLGCGFLFAFHSNYGRIFNRHRSVCRTVYEIFSVKEWRDLDTGDRGRSRSLKWRRSIHTTFYRLENVNENFEWPWVILSDLPKYSITRSVARSLCDSWASCLHLCVTFSGKSRHTRWGWAYSSIKTSARCWAWAFVLLLCVEGQATASGHVRGCRGETAVGEVENICTISVKQLTMGSRNSCR